MSLDDFLHQCVVKKALNMNESYKFYKIYEPDNVLRECYYNCNGYRLMCELMRPNDNYESKLRETRKTVR